MGMSEGGSARESTGKASRRQSRRGGDGGGRVDRAEVGWSGMEAQHGQEERAGSGGSGGKCGTDESGGAAGSGSQGSGGGSGGSGGGGGGGGGAAFNMLAMLAAAQQGGGGGGGGGGDDAAPLVEIEMHQRPVPPSPGPPAARLTGGAHEQQHQPSLAPPSHTHPWEPPCTTTNPVSWPQLHSGAAVIDDLPAPVVGVPPTPQHAPAEQAMTAPPHRAVGAGGGDGVVAAGGTREGARAWRGAAFNLRAMLDAAGVEGDEVAEEG